MFRILCAVGLIAITLSVAGCGNSNDTLIENQIRDMNAMADAIEKGASEEEIKKIEERMKENEQQLEALDLTKAEQEELMKKHSDAIEKASERMMNAMMASVAEEFAKLDNEFENLGEFEGMEDFNLDNEVE